MEHPNLEVLQVADRLAGAKDPEEEEKPVGKKGAKKVAPKEAMLSVAKLSTIKEIQIRLQQNEALKKLELRFVPLHRQVLQALFRGVAKNRALQKLILTHECLN